MQLNHWVLGALEKTPSDWQGDKKKQIFPIFPQFKVHLMVKGKWLFYFIYLILILMASLKLN